MFRWLFLFSMLFLLFHAQILDASITSRRPETRITDEEQYLNRVIIIGNKNVKRSAIKNQLRLKPLPFHRRIWFWVEKPEFNPAQMNQDAANILALLQANGFLYSEINTVTTKTRTGKINIEYRITENHPVRVNEVAVIVNDTLRVEGAMRRANIRNLFEQRWIETHSGNIFSDETIYNDVEFINHEFVKEGFLRANTDFRVHLHEDSLKVNTTVDIEYLVYPERRYYMQGYQIIGTRSVDRRTIRNHVVFRDSLVYRQEYVTRSTDNLMRLGIFRSINIFPSFIEDTQFVYPTIRFMEKPKWVVMAGAGWGSEEGFRAFAQLSHHNMYKKADQQHWSVRWSKLEPWNVRFTLIQPAFFHPRLVLTVAPFTVRERETEPSYLLDRYGGTTTLSYLMLNDWDAHFSYMIEQKNMREMEVPDPNYLWKKINTEATFSTNLNINYSFPKLNPHRGIHSMSGIGLTTQDIEGLYDYYSLSQELRYYQPISRHFILALRGQIKTMDEVKDNVVIPIENRFFLGGVQSVRGYARNTINASGEGATSVGGRSSLLFNAEARIPFPHNINMAVLYDAGQVQQDSYSFDLRDMSQSLGLGVRYVSPVGVIRFDVAKPIDKPGSTKYYLTLGESF